METLLQVSCAHCGVIYDQTRSNRIYCSRDCKNQAYAKRQQAYLNEVKLSSGCVRCGYKQHSAALQFNHINPLEKSFQLGGNFRKTKEKLDAEIAKCEVLCANCHSIHSYETHHTKVARLGAA
jgi:5-methylcytosine-specific restriction endonuclease McrA